MHLLPSLSRQSVEVPAKRVAAVLGILILLFGWSCWTALSPRGGVGPGTGQAALGLIDCEKRLAPKELGAVPDAECAAISGRLVSLAQQSGIDPREELVASLPDPHEVIAMLSRDRDISDYEEYASRGGPIGAYYGREAELASLMRPLRSRYESAYASAYSAIAGAPAEGPTAAYLGGQGRKKPYVASPDDVWFPPRSDLSRTHQYAIDIFFFHVDRSGEAERGPAIRAISPGIVVCSASDWESGPGEEAWRSGGLSPAAGDGLIVYDPATRRFVSYFHLSSLARRTGDIVKAGDVLGRGGNTGAHARARGHGEHVHVEIFDCARGENLSIFEEYDLLRR
jgi:hypothetical protein